MNALEIITKKRDGLTLTPAEIGFFITGHCASRIPDYQMAALLMAIYLRGMEFEETACLTDVMLTSGERIAFPLPDDTYVDKHSTGGVGDKVSLILAPLVATCGVRVPMLSGRGLGHTGGTLDKLESIPGFRTDLTLAEFAEQTRVVGCVISGQTSQMAPVDREIYALRHATATVESIPLICASILSKKSAAGARGLVFDIKCGNGAFMKSVEVAENLAQHLIRVSKAMGKNAVALITDMNQPLGYAAGNILEVTESIEAMLGTISPDLAALTIELGAEMLLLAGIEQDRTRAVGRLKEKLQSGAAFTKFEEMVLRQGGDLTIFCYPTRVPKAPAIGRFQSPQDGYIRAFDTASLGNMILHMGGGRKRKDDTIDPLVGLRFFKKIGDRVSAGEDCVEIHAADADQLREAKSAMAAFITIGPERIDPPALIKKRIYGIDPAPSL